MSPGLPGADVKFLANVVSRLAQRRLHAYHPGMRRSAAALILRFDDRTQQTLTAALAAYEATRSNTRDTSDDAGRASSSSSSVGGGSASSLPVDPMDVVRHLQQHCVDPSAPSALQLLFLKRADVDASRWSGQIAFPGGRRDPDDADDFATVCREAYEELGLPLQHHRHFICLGRLPDYRLHSRAVTTTGGLVQARFVFLHVGDMTPAVQLASHMVESARWLPLRCLTESAVEYGCVAHPLQSFVHPQDADYRVLLSELFPGTFLSFPSVLLPQGELQEAAAGSFSSTKDGTASSSSPSSGQRSWRVWGLTLRSAHELMALDDRPPFDWPLVQSNSLVLQYGLLFPFHGYYELLYQRYYWRAYAVARARAAIAQHSPLPFLKKWSLASETSADTRDRLVLHGSAMARRYAVLPASADALLFAAPEQPIPAHVASFCGVVAAVVFLFYGVASVLATAFAAVRHGVGVGAALEREERRRADSHRATAEERGGGDDENRDDTVMYGDSRRDAAVELLSLSPSSSSARTESVAAHAGSPPHLALSGTTQLKEVRASTAAVGGAGSWWRMEMADADAAARASRHGGRGGRDESALAAELTGSEPEGRTPPLTAIPFAGVVAEKEQSPHRAEESASTAPNLRGDAGPSGAAAPSRTAATTTAAPSPSPAAAPAGHALVGVDAPPMRLSHSERPVLSTGSELAEETSYEEQLQAVMNRYRAA